MGAGGGGGSHRGAPVRSFSPALQAILASGQFKSFYLYRLMAGGTEFLMTDRPTAVTIGVDTYVPQQVDWGDVTVGRGLSKELVTIDFSNVGPNDAPFPVSALVVNSSPTDLWLEVDQFFPDAGPSGEVVELFKGRPFVRELTVSNVEFALQPPGAKLERDFPFNALSAMCRWVFGDAVTCQANNGAVAAQTVDVGSTATNVVDAARTEDGAYTGPGTYWSDGRILFEGNVTAALAGVRRAVRASAVGSIDLIIPLPAIPAAGDRYDLRRGCNRSFEVCTGRFANEARFGNFVDLPTAPRL